MPLSDTYADIVAKRVFQCAAFAAPTGLTIALYTVAPTATGGGTEVSTSGTGYARQSLAPSATNWPAGAAGIVSNGSVVTFTGNATAGWGTIVAVQVFDQAGARVAYATKDLGGSNISIPVNSGDSCDIQVGQLQFTAS